MCFTIKKLMTKQFLTIAVCGVLFSSCASNITVRKPISFEGNTGQLPLTVGIFIQEDVQARKDQNKLIRYWLGDSLNRSIDGAFSRVFTGVRRIDSLENIPSDIKYS